MKKMYLCIFVIFLSALAFGMQPKRQPIKTGTYKQQKTPLWLELEQLAKNANAGDVESRIKLIDKCNLVLNINTAQAIRKQILSFFTLLSAQAEPGYSRGVANHALTVITESGDKTLGIEKNENDAAAYRFYSMEDGNIYALVGEGFDYYKKKDPKTAIEIFDEAIGNYLRIPDEREKKLYTLCISKAYFYKGHCQLNDNIKNALDSLRKADEFNWPPASEYLFSHLLMGEFGVTPSLIKEGEKIRAKLLQSKNSKAKESLDEHNFRIMNYFINDGKHTESQKRIHKFSFLKDDEIRFRALLSNINLDEYFHLNAIKRFFVEHKLSDEDAIFMGHFFDAMYEYDSPHYLLVAKYFYKLRGNEWSKALTQPIFLLLKEEQAGKKEREMDEVLKRLLDAKPEDLQKNIKCLYGIIKELENRLNKLSVSDFLYEMAFIKQEFESRSLIEKANQEQKLATLKQKIEREKDDIVWDVDTADEILENSPYNNRGVVFDEYYHLYNVAPNQDFLDTKISYTSKATLSLKQMREKRKSSDRPKPARLDEMKGHVTQIDWHIRKKNSKASVSNVQETKVIPQIPVKPVMSKPANVAWNRAKTANLKPKTDNRNLRYKYKVKENKYFQTLNPTLDPSNNYSYFWYNCIFWPITFTYALPSYKAVLDLSLAPNNWAANDSPAFVKVLPFDPEIECIIVQILDGRISVRILYPGAERTDNQWLPQLLESKRYHLNLLTKLHSLQENLKQPLTKYSMSNDQGHKANNPWKIRVISSLAPAYVPGQKIYYEALYPPKEGGFDAIQIEAAFGARVLEIYHEGKKGSVLMKNEIEEFNLMNKKIESELETLEKDFKKMKVEKPANEKRTLQRRHSVG